MTWGKTKKNRLALSGVLGPRQVWPSNKKGFGCGSKLNRGGYAGLVHVSTYQDSIWYRIFEPQPFGKSPGYFAGLQKRDQTSARLGGLENPRPSVSARRPSRGWDEASWRLLVVSHHIWLWLTKPVPKWNPGKWKHGPKPAVCPSCLILSHTHLPAFETFSSPKV